MHETALDSLRPLIAQARAEKKWLHCSYRDLWFSPDELEAANREGRFRWGAVNWTLRDSNELVASAMEEVCRAMRNLDRIHDRIARSK
jgi:hypothetical protein